MTWEEWSSVLRLSTMWGFARIRAIAITKLSELSLDPIDKIILAKQHNVDEWLAPALNEVARREASLCLDDVTRLEPVVGWDFILKIAQVRESQARDGANTTGNQRTYCGTCGFRGHCPSDYCNGGTPILSRTSHDYTATICTVFGLAA